ncbi:MAG: hypothetical protein ACT4PL_09525 [Phycisphaerales bacterium]
MAAKVNPRFVVGLAATIVLIVVVSWYLTTRFVYKPASTYITLAEQAEPAANAAQAELDKARAALAAARATKNAEAVKSAQATADAALVSANKEWNTVALAYSKAVSKERTNVEFLKRWLATLSKITPQPIDVYRDRFDKEWITTQRQLADAAPGDLKVQSDWLNLMISELRLTGGSPSAWERFILDVENALRGFIETDAGHKSVRRFRGMARVEAMIQAADTAEEKAMLAKDDLEAALSVDPEDAEAAATFLTWHRLMAVRAAKSARSAEAEQFVKDGLALGRTYVATRTNIAPVLYILTQTEMSEIARNRKPGDDMKALETAQRALVVAMVDRALTLPPKLLDRNSAFTIAATAIGADIENSRDRAMALIHRCLYGHHGDSRTML